MTKGRPIERFVEWLELLVSRRAEIGGLSIAGTERNSPAWRGIEEALNLIKRYDPVAYARLRRDLAFVWVRVLPGALGSFHPTLKACMLDERFLVATISHPELIAAVVVHEATHARLMRCGIGYEERLRERVEAVCARRELALAVKLPNGEQIRQQVESRLKWSPDIWTDAAMSERYVNDAAAALRHLGVPGWAIWGVFRVRGLIGRIRLNLRPVARRGGADPRRGAP